MNVQFKSGKTLEWDGSFENIPDLAEANGIEIENVCRIGSAEPVKSDFLRGKSS